MTHFQIMQIPIQSFRILGMSGSKRRRKRNFCKTEEADFDFRDELSDKTDVSRNTFLGNTEPAYLASGTSSLKVTLHSCSSLARSESYIPGSPSSQHRVLQDTNMESPGNVSESNHQQNLLPIKSQTSSSNSTSFNEQFQPQDTAYKLVKK